jgi:Spy/CpxP family protein refolding chaperone
MKTKIIIPLLVFMFAAAASAQRGPEHRGFARHHSAMFGIEMLAEELKLTEQQLAQIKEQRFAREKNAIQTRSKIQLAELELRNLLQADNVDENQVKSKVEEIGKLKTELRLNRVQGRLAVQKILTPEQKETLKTIHKERLQNRRGEDRPFPRQKMFRQFQGDNRDFDPEDFDFELEGEFSGGTEL